jgi:hypothetical protein
LPWKSSAGYSNIGKALIADWQLNGVFGAFSGLPFTVRANQASLNTPSNTQTGNLNGDANQTGAVGSGGTFYDVSNFSQPTGQVFGNTGRNQFRGPGGVNLDLSLFRSFPLGATRRLEFRVEGGNITNTPKFANPSEDMTSPNFMRITSVANNNGQAQYAERQFRVGLRFSF